MSHKKFLFTSYSIATPEVREIPSPQGEQHRGSRDRSDGSHSCLVSNLALPLPPALTTDLVFSSNSSSIRSGCCDAPNPSKQLDKPRKCHGTDMPQKRHVGDGSAVMPLNPAMTPTDDDPHKQWRTGIHFSGSTYFQSGTNAERNVTTLEQAGKAEKFSTQFSAAGQNQWSAERTEDAPVSDNVGERNFPSTNPLDGSPLVHSLLSTDFNSRFENLSLPSPENVFCTGTGQSTIRRISIVSQMEHDGSSCDLGYPCYNEGFLEESDLSYSPPSFSHANANFFTENDDAANGDNTSHRDEGSQNKSILRNLLGAQRYLNATYDDEAYTNLPRITEQGLVSEHGIEGAQNKGRHSFWTGGVFGTPSFSLNYNKDAEFLFGEPKNEVLRNIRDPVKPSSESSPVFAHLRPQMSASTVFRRLPTSSILPPDFLSDVEPLLISLSSPNVQSSLDSFHDCAKVSSTNVEFEISHTEGRSVSPWSVPDQKRQLSSVTESSAICSEPNNQWLTNTSAAICTDTGRSYDGKGKGNEHSSAIPCWNSQADSNGRIYTMKPAEVSREIDSAVTALIEGCASKLSKCSFHKSSEVSAASDFSAQDFKLLNCSKYKTIAWQFRHPLKMRKLLNTLRRRRANETYYAEDYRCSLRPHTLCSNPYKNLHDSFCQNMRTRGLKKMLAARRLFEHFVPSCFCVRMARILVARTIGRDTHNKMCRLKHRLKTPHGPNGGHRNLSRSDEEAFISVLFHLSSRKFSKSRQRQAVRMRRTNKFLARERTNHAFLQSIPATKSLALSSQTLAEYKRVLSEAASSRRCAMGRCNSKRLNIRRKLQEKLVDSPAPGRRFRSSISSDSSPQGRGACVASQHLDREVEHIISDSYDNQRVANLPTKHRHPRCATEVEHRRNPIIEAAPDPDSRPNRPLVGVIKTKSLPPVPSLKVRIDRLRELRATSKGEILRTKSNYDTPAIEYTHTLEQYRAKQPYKIVALTSQDKYFSKPAEKFHRCASNLSTSGERNIF